MKIVSSILNTSLSRYINAALTVQSMSGRLRDDIGEVGPSYGGEVKEEGDTSESGDAGSSHSMAMSIYQPSYESPPDLIPGILTL